MFQKWFGRKSGKSVISNRGAIFVLSLGSIEFITAAVSILLITPDPKHGFLFGYSLQRIGIFLLTILPGIFLLALAIQAYRRKNSKLFEIVFLNNRTLWVYISFVFAIAGFIVLISPPSLFGQFESYFERLRPLLVVVGFFPLQLSLKWIIAEDRHIDRSLLRYASIGLGVILLMISSIVISKIGITPDHYDYWKLAGIPLTGIQFASILLATAITFGAIAIIWKYFPSQNKKYIDFLLMLGIYLFATLTWGSTPMVKEFYFSLHPAAPYYQPFPFSDARVHDLGALSIMNGWGIDFGEYTDKPFYMVFLAILHLIAGHDYNLLAQVQVYFLALIPVILYLFGKSFHSRFLGLVIALTVVVRQRNAILLSNIVDSANPKLFITEVLTLLGLILFTWLVFLWFKNRDEHPWIAFAAGSTLGVVSLVRLNPVLLLPAIPLLALFLFWRQKRKWIVGSAAFILGFVILLAPWMLTGLDANGQPYFIIKFLDIIHVRYSLNSMELKPDPGSVFQKQSLFSLTSHIVPPVMGSDKPGPFIDINHFPGFVLNNFFHNIVATFLELPDSFRPSDQNLISLVKRPYWLRTEMLHWSGEIDPGQLPFMFLNMCLLATGLAWSWKRWQWAGIIPVLVFLIYDLGLALARTSGSRYIVPIDWIMFFYFGTGVIFLLGFLPAELRRNLYLEPTQEINPTSIGHSKYTSSIWVIMLIACATSLVPIADNIIPQNKSLCTDNDSLRKLASQLDTENSNPNIHFIKGQVLYPEFRGSNLAFTLLGCKKAIPLEIRGFNSSVENGQTVIVGLSDAQTLPQVEIIISPENGTHTAEILWPGE